MKRITLALQAPYVGLRPFGERDAVLFFGRKQHVQELLKRLKGQQRFIAVLGASGTGKSSLVRAGLIPALRCGALTSAGYDWNVCIFKPGNAPLTNLAQVLIEHQGWRNSDDRADAVASLSAVLAMSPLALTELYRKKANVIAGRALLLVVDQFEEIFRYRQKNVDEAEAFINLLLRSASEDVPIHVVMTMRSDYLDNCVAFYGLPEAINHGIYLTPRLGPDQLKSIIASPLALVNSEIDPVLVSKLVNTLGDKDELSIMEHALLRMWNRAHGSGHTRIETEDFESVCASRNGYVGQARLAYAINNHASEIYDALSSEDKRIARQLFLALVERRDDREVRRPQTVKQLVESVGERQRENLLKVINAFRAEQVGFLLPHIDTALTDDNMIDISHESLFRHWHLFRQWLNEEDADVDELKEWQGRAGRQKEGGSLLDAYDCQRAIRWRTRVIGRTDPAVWAKRYSGLDAYEKVSQYIEKSQVREVARAERLARETKEAEPRLLELPSSFHPPFLLRNAHLMTLVPRYWPRDTSLLGIPQEERLFTVEPLTQLKGVCHWQDSRRLAPTVILVHGLEGSCESRYVRGIAAKAYRSGFNVVRMNQRTCGGTEHLSPTLYNSGLSGDYRAIVNELVHRDELDRIWLVGYSMGGNLVLKAAGELGGAEPALAGVAAVCPNINPAVCARALEEPRNWIYHRHFLARLKSHLRKQAAFLPGKWDLSVLGQISTISEFDDRYTARDGGYRDGADYYDRAGARHVLHAIAVPTLIITAQDDPFIPYSMFTLPQVQRHSHIRVVAPDRGGHCGFFQSSRQGEDRYWAENRMVDFVLGRL